MEQSKYAHLQQYPVLISCPRFPGHMHHGTVAIITHPDGTQAGGFNDGCEESRSACSACDQCVEWCTNYFINRPLPPDGPLYPPNSARIDGPAPAIHP